MGSNSFLNSRGGWFPYAVLCVFMAIVVLSPATARPATLRYHPKADSKFAYNVEIIADLSELVATSEGVITYEVTESGDMLKLKYSGGLRKTIKRKPSDKQQHGPSPFPFPLLFRSAYDGLAHTNNRISLTPRGGLNHIEGSSQLPYLLGNLSLLIFEPLPAKDQKSWTARHGVSLFEKSSSARRWRHMPFWQDNGPEKTTAGSETVSFSLQSDNDDLTTYKKTYRLYSAEGKQSVDITGKGSWTFNRRINMPESLDFRYTLVCKEENISIDFPITVKYHRLSDEEFAKYEKEQEEKRQKNDEEHKQRLAYQKAPLTGDQRRKVLADLKSRDLKTLREVLQNISQKDEREDQEIANAIKRHLHHSDSIVRNKAEAALAKFSPQLGQKIKINKAYSGIGSVNVMGPSVTAQTPLPRGLIVAVNDFGPWYKPAKVVRNLGNGTVELQFNHSHRTKIVDFSKIRLAPPEVDQPLVSERVLAKIYSGHHPLGAATDDADDYDSDGRGMDDHTAVKKSDRGYRIWTDNTGTFAVVAKYVGIEGDKVCLQRKSDGKSIKVSLIRLSRPDRQLAKRLEKSSQTSNPFEP